ncbi:MAG: hypothetical protein GY821_13220 [Gammaproteobacteria bacterium]|nr:hypothetical protein [Gammaproteobacteria bacterium]
MRLNESHYLTAAPDGDIKAIRPQNNANPQKKINEIRRELIDQEISTLRTFTAVC